VGELVESLGLLLEVLADGDLQLEGGLLLTVGDRLGGAVVERRHVLLLHAAHCEPEAGPLVGELGVGGIGGHVHLGLGHLVGALADHRSAQLGDEHPLLHLDLHRPARGARDLLAVGAHVEVGDDHVSLPHRPLDRLQRGLAVEQLLHPAIDHLVGDLGVGPLDPDRVEVGKLHLGHHADGRGEAGRLAPLELEDVDPRPVDGVDPALGEGAVHDLRDQRLDRLLPDRLGPEAGFNHRAGSLAGPEALDLHLLGELGDHLLEGAVDLLGGDLDRQGDLAPRQGFPRDHELAGFG